MTILTALAGYYDRLAAKGDAPPYGYARQRIGAKMVIAADGTPLRLRSLGDPAAKRPGRDLAVPQNILEERTAGTASNFAWDKTAYALGVIAGKDEQGKPVAVEGKRTAEEHADFKALMQDALSNDRDDPEIAAFLQFLDCWGPAEFNERRFDPALLDRNVIFSVEGGGVLHDHPLVQAAWARRLESGGEPQHCLVSGREAVAARLHPKIKGVWGAQSSGGNLVSFNIGSKDEKSAASSHGKAQGENAPVSEAAAFAYGTALNILLAGGSQRRIVDRDRTLKVRQSSVLADTTMVFWAETNRGEPAAEAAEAKLAVEMNIFEEDDDEPSPDASEEQGELNQLDASLERVQQGRASADPAPDLDPETRVHILGLSPNNARLSVRFWHSARFDDFAKRLEQHREELRIEPAGFRSDPAAWALLLATAPQGKRENVPPMLAGQLCARS